MTNPEKVVNFTIDNVVSEILAIDDQVRALHVKRSEFEADLQGFISDDVTNQLADKDYNCGTATVETAEYKLKYVVSKKVDWSQDGLKMLAQQIASSGEDPGEYIKVAYDVSEQAYKNWPSKYRSAFEPFRTVKQSKPKITFERKE